MNEFCAQLLFSLIDAESSGVTIKAKEISHQ